MNHTLRLGFRTFFNPPSFFEVTKRKPQVGALVFVKHTTMDLHSKSDSSGRNVVVEGGQIAENQIGVNNMNDIEKMTVRELRIKLRNLGVPAKGYKSDLISALKSSIFMKIDGENSQHAFDSESPLGANQITRGYNSKRKDNSLSSEDHLESMNEDREVSARKKIKRRAKQSPMNGKDSVELVEDQISSRKEHTCSGKNLKPNAKCLSSEDHAENTDNISEDSGRKQANRKVKQAPVENSTEDVKTTRRITREELSLNTNEVAAKKPTRGKKGVSPEIVWGDIGSSENVDISEHKVEPWTVLAHKKPQKGWIPYNPRTMRPPPLASDVKKVKLMSWNVNGLRALLKLEGFSALELAQREDFDVLCLQETKLQDKDVEAMKQALLEGYENSFWTCSVSKLGYSGTAIISRIAPLSVRYGLGASNHDSEGRLVTTEFDSFFLISGYVPNSGDGLRRLSYRVTEWDPTLSSYMKELEKSKPVILTGDLNCAHEEIDIYNPAGNKRSAGFTIEERMSFEKNFLNNGFVDTFRMQHPGVVGYTYWGYRHGGRKTNKGWRLDYFLVSESIAENVHDSYILPDVTGSDHCPIGLILKL